MLPPVSAGELRLLRILELDPEIRCDVQTFPLDATPEGGYFALSYCWGIERPTSKILINDGDELSITPTLHSALRELHRREEIRGAWHWIDQICINQGDKPEKNAQVKQMARVYRGAKRVLVWLGEASEDSNLAMDNLDQLITQMGTTMPTTLSEQEEIQRKLAPRHHPVWRAIVNLYGRPWFRRVWILQEVVLASGVFVLCGDRTLIWSHLVKFANSIMAVWPAVLMTAGQDPYDTRVSGFVSCSQIERYRGFALRPDLGLFNNLLTTTRDRESTLPIDYVYGVSGMISEHHRDLIHIDYDMAYHDAVVTFCKTYIRIEPSLTLLGMASSKEKSDGIPSWCPDFGKPSTESSPLYVFLGFKAGFEDWNHRASQIQVSDIENEISVPGFRIDVVAKVAEGTFEPPGQNSAQEASDSLEWLQECESLFREAYAEQTSVEWEMFCQTLIADHFAADKPLPVGISLREVYRAFKKYLTEIADSVASSFESPAERDAVLRFNVAVALHRSRRFFITERRIMGLGPSRIQPNDVVCAFHSGACLWALRFDKRTNKAQLVGDAYMQGLMDLTSTSAELKEKDERFTVC